MYVCECVFGQLVGPYVDVHVCVLRISIEACSCRSGGLTFVNEMESRECQLCVESWLDRSDPCGFTVKKRDW